MRFVALCSLRLLAGCGTGRVPFAPVLPDPTLRVRVDIPAQEYPAGEPVLATITNASSFPVFLADVCGSEIETRTGDRWETVPLVVLCTAELRVPLRIDPGASIARYVLTRHANGEAVPPGTYRARFLVSKADDSFDTHYSPEFGLE